MANRSSHRSRSRKRRASAPKAASTSPVAVEEKPVGEASEGRIPAPESRIAAARRARAEARPESRRRPRERNPSRERPPQPWHPLPLSELLILVGAVAVVVGLRRGSSGHAVLLAGIGAAAIGTLEVTLREHLGGYRSHTVLLALLPALALHTAVILIVAAFARVPRALNIGLLVPDAAVFAFFFKLLRMRFVDARRRRNFA